MRVVDEIASTNSACRDLPAWHAVRARVQTGGRGRTGRYWVSDDGGLWLSAVLPCPGDRAQWAVLPLAIGWALIRTLEELGVSGLRLRWPNDLMAGRRKLAGLLLERFNGETAIAGIGLNVRNAPDAAEPSLAGSTARLADLVPAAGTLDDLTRLVLESVARGHALIAAGDLRLITNDLNTRWSVPGRVSVTLAGGGGTLLGRFLGIDDTGRLRIHPDRGEISTYDASQIALFREID